MTRLVRVFVAAVLALWLGVAAAQQLEIVTLKYRVAEQLVPQLQPLVEPGGALTGTGNKLFLRTSPRNLADLRRVIDELDRAPRRLMISVRQGAAAADDAGGAGVSAVLAPGASSVRAEVYATRERGRDQIAQRVQTIEGGRAWIVVGQSIPVPLRQVAVTPRGPVVSETVSYVDIGSGFYAEPHLAGDRVTLDISPSRDTPGALPGSVNVQRLTTTVSGRLGEWLELGGSRQDGTTTGGGALSYGTRGGSDDRRVWLKVEELP